MELPRDLLTDNNPGSCIEIEKENEIPRRYQNPVFPSALIADCILRLLCMEFVRALILLMDIKYCSVRMLSVFVSHLIIHPRYVLLGCGMLGGHSNEVRFIQRHLRISTLIGGHPGLSITLHCHQCSRVRYTELQ